MNGTSDLQESVSPPFRYDTFCGLYCGACDVLQANRNGTASALARAWGMEPEEVHCRGCKSEINAIYCRDCDLKACASGKQIEYCFQCADYPCARLVGFRNDGCAHHAAVLQNQSRLRRLGLDRWLAEQRARWSCPRCGTGFGWYDEVCSVCGTELYNSRDEECPVVDGVDDDG